MIWDDPRLFEDQSIYQQVHRLVTSILENEGTAPKLTESDSRLLHHLVAGSMDAVSESIKKSTDSDSRAELVEILEDLLKFSENLAQNALH